MNKKSCISWWELPADEYSIKYRDFMYNPDNIGQCEYCPENRNDTNSFSPCGQQNCWVRIHCKEVQR